MTPEEFQKLVDQSQPHKVFNNDWQTFYSIDFADTLLPDVKGYTAKAMRMYDGANLFLDFQKAQQKLYKLTDSKEYITLISYSYPKGVEAERKKNRVQPADHEVCTFMEVSEDDSMEVFFKLGKNFKSFLNDYASKNKSAITPYLVENTIYKTDIPKVKAQFNRSLVHYNMMEFVLNTMGVTYGETAISETLLVKIDAVRAKTAEQADGKKYPVKGKTHKSIIVDFEIINKPALSYDIYVFKLNEAIFQEHHLPDPNFDISSKLIPQDAPQLVVPNHTFQPGKYSIEWDCSDNGIFETQDDKANLRIEIKAIGENNKLATDQKLIPIMKTVAKAEIDSYIILLDPDNDYKEYKVFSSEILERQKKLKDSIAKEEYDKLTKEEQLIIDLPIIMVKLGWVYGAFCQIHWLECNEGELVFPNQFIMSYQRTQEAIIQLQEDLKLVEYASTWDWYHQKNDPPQPLHIPQSILLYQEDLKGSFPKNYNKAIAVLRKIDNNEPHEFGNFTFPDKNDNPKEELPPKMNFVRSYSVGNQIEGFAIGDYDDLGAALGLFSMRVYVRGVIIEQPSGRDGFRQFSLNIIDVGFRFTDVFSFEGWQPLGYWKYNLENVEKPKIASTSKEWENLSNATYNNLRDKLPQLGGDFKIRTPLLFFANQSPKDVIFFIKSKEK